MNLSTCCKELRSQHICNTLFLGNLFPAFLQMSSEHKRHPKSEMRNMILEEGLGKDVLD